MIEIAIIIIAIVTVYGATRVERILNNLREISEHLRALRWYEEDKRKQRVPAGAPTEEPRPQVAPTPVRQAVQPIFQVKRGGTILGQFTEAEFREKIFSNEIEPTDLYRSNDVSNWASVSNYRINQPETA
jgi:hypothetical protein